jgi:hypothetical protein
VAESIGPRGGSLFQGRFKAVLVENDSHALELTRYVHLNVFAFALKCCWILRRPEYVAKTTGFCHKAQRLASPNRLN